MRIVFTNGRVDGALAFEDLLEGGEDELSPTATHRDDQAFWLYSSGSTGRPKGAVHLHHDINYTCETYARHVLEVTEDGQVLLGVQALPRLRARQRHLLPVLGRSLDGLVPGQADAGGDPRDRRAMRTDAVLLGADALQRYGQPPGAEDYDLSSIRLCVSAAEALPARVWRRWKETFDLIILDGIGSTEMLHIFVSNTPDALEPGSSGKPVPGYEAKILDEEGHPVEPGGAGYLYVRGDSAAAYYWRNHEKTKATMQGEWMFAGDWYRMDEDGFYWYEGRADDMIKVSGLWVSPVEVENTLVDHGAVMEAAAVGVPVDGLTRVKAFVVLRDGYEGPEELVEELQTWCKENLKRYQYPHIVEFIEELPKTVTGKIQRFKLRGHETAANMPRDAARIPQKQREAPRQEDELV